MIKVNFEVFSSAFQISKCLQRLSQLPVLSFDTEVAGIYPKSDRAEAKKILKSDNASREAIKLASLVEANSGLSFPSLVRVTHFVFGTGINSAVILVCDTPTKEMLVWNWVAKYPGKLIIHNTLFDLKIMYHRVQALPLDYEDSQLLAKAYTNNAENWKAKVGLKDLMASHYDPAWTLIDEYEPEDLHDPKFLRYASIDGAACFKLWLELQECSDASN